MTLPWWVKKDKLIKSCYKDGSIYRILEIAIYNYYQNVSYIKIQDIKSNHTQEFSLQYVQWAFVPFTILDVFESLKEEIDK